MPNFKLYILHNDNKIVIFLAKFTFFTEKIEKKKVKIHVYTG